MTKNKPVCVIYMEAGCWVSQKSKRIEHYKIDTFLIRKNRAEMCNSSAVLGTNISSSGRIAVLV